MDWVPKACCSSQPYCFVWSAVLFHSSCLFCIEVCLFMGFEERTRQISCSLSFSYDCCSLSTDQLSTSTRSSILQLWRPHPQPTVRFKNVRVDHSTHQHMVRREERCAAKRVSGETCIERVRSFLAHQPCDWSVHTERMFRKSTNNLRDGLSTGCTGPSVSPSAYIPLLSNTWFKPSLPCTDKMLDTLYFPTCA